MYTCERKEGNENRMDYKKKNLKMNETLEKEQMMKQMNSNLQNKMHK